MRIWHTRLQRSIEDLPPAKLGGQSHCLMVRFGMWSIEREADRAEMVAVARPDVVENRAP